MEIEMMVGGNKVTMEGVMDIRSKDWAVVDRKYLEVLQEVDSRQPQVTANTVRLESSLAEAELLPRAFESLHGDLTEQTQAVWSEVADYLDNKQKIYAIKRIREEFGLGLRNAKMLVEIFAKFRAVSTEHVLGIPDVMDSDKGTGRV